MAFITLLLVLQLTGEAIVVLTGLPVPGPVVGMVLLLVGLIIRGSVPEGLSDVTGKLLRHLSLLFVPAGVGVTLHLSLIKNEWLPISAALIVATLFTIVVSAAVMSWLQRKTGA